MIDTHAHLYAEQFSNDIDQVLNRAFENGISKIFLPNIDVESIEGLNNLRDAHPESIYGMMGLHPCSVSEDYKEELKTLKKTLYDGNYIAVGEIGIDLYWDKSTLPLQQEAFIEQCNWAIELGLPIAIHSRESNNEILDILENEFKGRITGVFHCFSGNEKQLQRILDLGFYLGIGGVVTFKNSNLREVLKGAHINRIVLETDAPYLAPTPYRGKRNESSYVVNVAQEIAKIYSLELKEVDEITTANALKLFNL